MVSRHLRSVCLWLSALAAALWWVTRHEAAFGGALGFAFAALLIHTWHRFWHPPAPLPRNLHAERQARAATQLDRVHAAHAQGEIRWELDEVIPIESARLPDVVRHHAQRFRTPVTHVVVLGDDEFALVADSGGLVDLIHLR